MAFITKLSNRRAQYRVHWWAKGKQRSRCFELWHDAVRWKQKVEAGTTAVRAGTVSLGAAIDAWLEDRRAVCSPATLTAYSAYVRGFLAASGDMRIDKLKSAHVEAWRNIRRRERSPVTVRQSIKAVRIFLNWAMKRGLVQSNVATQVTIPPTRRRIPGWIDQEETERLLAHLAEVSQEYHLVATFAARAGMRAGEIRALRWSDVDLAGDVIRVNEGKSKYPRLVPMHPQIRALLDRWPRTGEYIFPPLRQSESGKRGQQNKWLNRWMRENGYRLTMHGLRHSFASQLAEIGASENELRDLLGHTSVAVTRLYTHSRDSLKRTHVGMLGAAQSKPQAEQTPAHATPSATVESKAG